MWSTLHDPSRPWSLHDHVSSETSKLRLCPPVLNREMLDAYKKCETSEQCVKWFDSNRRSSLVEDIITCWLFCSLSNETGTMIHGLKMKQSTEVLTDVLSGSIDDCIKGGLSEQWKKMARLKNVDLSKNVLSENNAFSFKDKIKLVQQDHLNDPTDTQLRAIVCKVDKKWCKQRYYISTLRRLIKYKQKYNIYVDNLTYPEINRAFQLSAIISDGIEIDHLSILPAFRKLMICEVKDCEKIKIEEDEDHQMKRIGKNVTDALEQLRVRHALIESLHGDLFQGEHWQFLSVIALPSISKSELPKCCSHCIKYVITEEMMSKVPGARLTPWLESILGDVRLDGSHVVNVSDLEVCGKLSDRLLGLYNVSTDHRMGCIQAFSVAAAVHPQLEGIAGASDPVEMHEDVKKKMRTERPVLEKVSKMAFLPHQMAVLGCSNKRVLMKTDYGGGKTIISKTKAICLASTCEGCVNYISMAATSTFSNKAGKLPFIFDILSNKQLTKYNVKFLSVLDLNDAYRQQMSHLQDDTKEPTVYDLLLCFVQRNRQSNIFIDEYPLCGSYGNDDLSAALSCLESLMSESQGYMWVACRRRARGFTKSQNEEIQTCFTRIQQQHSVTLPQLNINLRSSPAITKFASDKDTVLSFQLPLDICQPCTSSSAPSTPPVTISAYGCDRDPQIMKSALLKAMGVLNIDPLNPLSTDSVVVLVDGSGFIDAVCSALPGDRVMVYLPAHGDTYTRPLPGCDVEQSLHSFMTSGGVLVTDADSYSGCEAANVICVGSALYTLRNGMLRAVSQLVWIKASYKSLPE